ncbi:MAG TPA: SPOR domain-containing protein, partial [Alphaproteobacteria bacterium]|nr:SPOR domain-containing protein [Alphaproteobacteria bacterium]
APVEPATTDGWVVQVGAAPTAQGASSLLSSAAGSVAGLGAFKPYVERFEKNGQVFFRARFGGFGDREDAAAMCRQLKQARMSCLAMQG